MRTQLEKTTIVNSFSDPISLENFLTLDEVQELILEFENNQHKIYKNTGPITQNIDLTVYPFSKIRDRLQTVLGSVEITAAFFFYTDRPHIIHNDDTYELPQVFKGITLPLAYEGNTPCPYLCFFHQYYLEGPAKFFKDGIDYPEYYNKHVIDYAEVNNLSGSQIPSIVYNKYLTHLKPQWLEGLSFDRAMPWKPGNAIIFDSVRLHCASDFKKQGITSKLGISIFTKINDDVVDEK